MPLLQNQFSSSSADLQFDYQSECHCSKTGTLFVAPNPGLITSQNATAPKRDYAVSPLDACLITSQNATAPKLHDVSFKNEIPWIDPKTGMKREFTETGANTPKRLMKYLEDTVQEGERYVIRYTPRGMDFRHVIILERSNGNLHMYDPQGDIEYLDAEYRNHIRCDIEYKRTSYGIKEEFPISIMRIDDLVFDEDIVNEILEPRK